MKIRTAVFALSVGAAGGLALLESAPAHAFPHSRPAEACAPMAADLSLPGLWLGHFSGGRLVRQLDQPAVLAWRDVYSCFDTARACAAWQRGLRREYRDQEGYRTCLPLRAGGVPIIREENVVRAKY
jgi:hypothetical protein